MDNELFQTVVFTHSLCTRYTWKQYACCNIYRMKEVSAYILFFLVVLVEMRIWMNIRSLEIRI